MAKVQAKKILKNIGNNQTTCFFQEKFIRGRKSLIELKEDFDFIKGS
jgi:hypothetical protein